MTTPAPVTCGHAELVADPEIEGWEDPTEPVVVILRCPECKQNARVVIEDVALLDWNDDPFGDPTTPTEEPT